MGTTIYPTVPVAQPEAEPWPIDEHTIRVDEMFARQLDNEFSAGVRRLLHDPETGVTAQRGERRSKPSPGRCRRSTISGSARWPGPSGRASAASWNR